MMVRNLAALALLALPVPALAADFSFVSRNGSWPDFYFNIDTMPAPDSFDQDGFNINDALTIETTSFGAVSYNANYRFYTDAALGGFENGYVAYYSRAMFSGDPSGPTFHNGVYKLADYSGGPTVGLLTVTNAAAALAVPEPQRWALIIAGLSAAGVAMRRRSRLAKA